ncbi:Hypothetical predicted protein [Paramuricea clavata]|uniref:Uncharacterized protein n=1 Tax=Paramuricea clavata TaxID=317549 RepID=A0A6S7H0M4_PARCT|nr:Hypothetical predicted protein [Paramuricea clavata]
MDPFTEKLLARTQARKAALAKKREEVASRSPVVTPRRPLAENNPKPLGSTPVRIGTTNTSTPVKPSAGTPVVVKSTEHVAGTTKSVFYEKFAKQASLQQKECFIELGEAKNALKPTPKKRELLQNGDKGVAHYDIVGSDEPTLKKVVKDDTVNTDSPSVKDRKALYMKQVQDDTNIASVKVVANQAELKTLQVKPIEPEKIFPSAKEPRSNLTGRRFFNDPRNNTCEDPPKPATKATPATKVIPAKPPRVTVTAKVINPKQPVAPERKKSEGTPTKPPRAGQNVPPSKPPRVQNSLSMNNAESDTKVKQSSVCISLKRPAPVPPSEDMTGEAKGSVQKASKRCESEAESNIPAKKSTLERNKDAKTALACTTTETVSSPRKGLLAPPAQSPAQQQCNNGVTTVNESTPTHDGPKEDFKRSLKSQKISAISLNDMDTSLNSHEITFNISMTEFDDALEEEKKAMFQMTYDESIKNAEKVQENKESCDIHNDYDMTAPVQATFKGVHKSGYHSSYSDQYAAVVTPKKVSSTKTRNFTVHETIQMLLEEAAYQQNIVLQASQAVNMCLALHEGMSTGSSEEVEAERLLRFSTERRTACLDQVQKLKTADEDDTVSMKSEDMEDDLPCKATLKISGIKIPVDKKMLANKNCSEPCIYSFICIVKHTPKQMYCTKAVSLDEVKNGCITFDDKFEIKNVKPSFTLDIHVFILKTQLPAVTPQNKTRKKSVITKKKGSDGTTQAVTPGSTHGPVFRTSGFALASTTHINLENIYSQKHQMHQFEERSALTGDIQIEIQCKPEYTNQAKGFLTIFEDVGGLGDWLRYWCILDGNVLNYWKYPDDDLIKPPLGSVNLSHCISESVTIVPRDICARPHTMQLVLEKPQTSSDRETLIAVNAGGKMLIKYMLSADTKADKETWLNTINDSLKDWRAWHHNLVQKVKQRSQSVESDVIML